MSATHQEDIGIFMVTVGGVIENIETGQVLLLQSSQSSQNGRGDSYELPMDSLYHGENPETGLKRVLNSELGLKDIKKTSVLGVSSFNRRTQSSELAILHLTYWIRVATPKLKLSDTYSNYEWLSLQEALSLNLDKHQKQEMQLFVKAKEDRDQVELARDKEQRIMADYQNLVRRTREERNKASLLASQLLIEDLVQPLEHLNLASKQINDPGLDMVKIQLWQALAQHGLEEINPLGQKFDLEVMEAVEKQGEGDTVVSVTRLGFRLNGKVIQHAKVVLGEKESAGK